MFHDGDNLVVRQRQTGNTHGGILIWADGVTTTLADQDGQPSDDDTVLNTWHNRVISLHELANKTYSGIWFGGGLSGGNFTQQFASIAVVSADGSVHTIFNGGEESPTYVNGPASTGANVSIAADDASVRYYASDHLGTAQMEVSAGGWPVSKSEFAPFGQELSDPSSTTNRYKFTGKERDTESGLDYFGARYYASTAGRFMSPDWAQKAEPVPYAKMDNPQSLNLYGYVGNNPINQADADGHEWRDIVNFVAGAMNAYGSDNLMGAGNVEQTTTAGRLGAMLGHSIAAGQGVGEVILGTGGNIAGAALDTTGIGAAIGVPVNAASTAVTLHGAGTATTAAMAMGKLNKSKTGPGSVPPSERAPQRTATPAEKAQKLSEQGGKCANCEKSVKNGEGIGHHYPDRHADGGKEIVVVCKECHTDLHSGEK
ncbi:MAG: RHS repeat-associated core domain-containing protein [Acidobacteria bacterium]|nr:RHS repeat-associated core domain-containing protein [Acidobacteriota bacterium]